MSLTKIGSIGINTGIAFAGVTTIVTLNTANDALSIGATVNVGSGITLGASGDIFATGVSTFSGNLKVGSGVTISPDGDGFYTGVVTATTFSGALAASSLTGALPAISAANLTNVPAANITGTLPAISAANLTNVPAANITGTLPAISGANLTNLDASDLASGTVPTARLGSGTASSSTFLRGDSTFAAVTSTTINNNADNRLITGSGTANTLEGETNLTYDGTTLKNQVAAENGTIAQFELSGQTNNPALLIKADESDQQITFRAGSSTSTYPSIAFDMGTVGDSVTIDSSGRLLIGTSDTLHSSGNNLIVGTGSGEEGMSIYSGTTSGGVINFAKGNSGADRYAGRIYFTHDSSAAHMRFMVNGEKVRILESGGITFNGDTAAANALDDYEEGLWTPTVNSGIDGGASYSIQRGWYCKIGGCVFVSFFMRLVNSATGSTGNGNQFQLGGLPYAVVTLSPVYSSGGFVTYTNMNFSGSSQIAIYTENGQTNLFFYRDRSAAASLSGDNSNKEVYGFAQYRTS